jgi:hypothetical protein
MDQKIQISFVIPAKAGIHFLEIKL